MSFLVIIPTYNEAENVGGIIEKVLEVKPQAHILIVDDNSQDGTIEIVKDLQKRYPSQVHLTCRKGKMGLGSAYVFGFRWALEKGYDYIAEMDADFSHPVEKLQEFEMLLSSKTCDVVIGSRYVVGGSVVNWPTSRKMISQLGSLYARMLTFMPVRDTTSGFVAYRKEVLDRLNLDAFSAEGYGFQIEMKLAAWKLGFKLKEIPICFKDRVMGFSKMNSNIIFEAMWRLIKISGGLMTGRYVKAIRKP